MACNIEELFTNFRSSRSIAFTIRTFLSKVISLLFNMLSMFVIAFLPKSKPLNFMAAVTIHSDLKAQENKICYYFHFFPIYLPWILPKGNQSWLFTGGTVAEAEAPILWPPDAKNWLIWKDPDAGKDWRWEEKGTAEEEMVGWPSPTQWTMSLSKL